MALGFYIPTALAGSAGPGTLLEEPVVATVGKEAEVRIKFSTQVRYIRHFPEGKGDVLRVVVDVVDPCVAEQIRAREQKKSPAGSVAGPFTISFPEAIASAGTGAATCASTGTRVELAQTILIQFDKERDFSVRLGDDGHSVVVAMPALAVSEGSQAPESKMAPVDLLVAGRAALAAGDPVKAIQLFNSLLNLPLNDYSREAQELVGVAREKVGEIAKAKAEYQLYLKLYPEGEGAARVKQRLAALEAMKEEPAQAKPEAKRKKQVREVHQNTVTGSVSQYYYGGKTQDSLPGSPANKTDISALLTNVDVTGRFRHNQYDTKIVFRDTQAHNFLPGISDKNTVSAAYVEHTNKELDYMFRIGRQTGTSQGILGRFDGIFARFGFTPQWRLAAVAGTPDNGSHSAIQTNRHFYGAAIEFGPLAEKWSGSVYGIQQVADGLTERRAVGTEMRYFSGTTSWFGLLDYDTIYKMVNIAMLQGNWVAFDGYNFNFLVDHRKSPILYSEIAIQADPTAFSVGDLRARFSSSDIYAFTRNLVPDSDMVMFGVTKQVSTNWQLGGDVRVNHISSVEGAGVALPQPGVSNIYTYTAQAIGRNTLFRDDTSVMMASYVDDPHYNAQNLAFTNSVMLHEKWRVDGSLRFYHENRDFDVRTWKVMPVVRLNYQWRENMSFEVEMSVDRTHVDDPLAGNSSTWRETLFAGYRWDYR